MNGGDRCNSRPRGRPWTKKLTWPARDPARESAVNSGAPEPPGEKCAKQGSAPDTSNRGKAAKEGSTNLSKESASSSPDQQRGSTFMQNESDNLGRGRQSTQLKSTTDRRTPPRRCCQVPAVGTISESSSSQSPCQLPGLGRPSQAPGISFGGMQPGCGPRSGSRRCLGARAGHDCINGTRTHDTSARNT